MTATNETWTFTDADWSASLGVSVKGEAWRRPDDTFGLAGIVSGASRDNQKFLEAGGTDMLDGDGALTYGWEKVLETYYDFQIWKTFTPRWITSSLPTLRSTATAAPYRFSGRDSIGNFDFEVANEPRGRLFLAA